jgi:hypothetical protein
LFSENSLLDLGNSAYIYRYFKLCLFYYAYVFSSTKLEIRAEQVLPRSEGKWEGEGVGGG